jgi:lipoprotein NlpD
LKLQGSFLVRNIIVLMLTSLLLMSCSGGHFFAPVTDSTHIEHIPKSGVHRVKHGETLYTIAWRFGLDYARLAKRNGLKQPYYLYTGEVIYLRGYAPGVRKKIHSSPSAADDREPNEQVVTWLWPANGPVIGPFTRLNRGINISGHRGDPIYAAAAGKVVYSGNGLHSYGNLIIIKHNSSFLTAYAHNDKNLVSEGEWVRPGQKIAEMGSTGTHRVMIHFEIRIGGEPMNPLSYLAYR